MKNKNISPPFKGKKRMNNYDYTDSNMCLDNSGIWTKSNSVNGAIQVPELPIEFTYLTQPPKKYTFEQPKLKKWTENICKGKVLNLFAGKTKLDVDEYRVDIDENMNPDYLGDAYKFVMTTKKRFDTLLFDPPYNLRKAREKYGNRYIGSATKIKNIIPKILNEGAIVISYGYDSVGMSKSRGFEKFAICLVCHNGDHNDTIVVAEKLIKRNTL